MLKRSIEQKRQKKLSDLILWVKVNSDTAPAWIGRFFTKRLGRLTARRRQAIFDTMPPRVAATKKMSRKGNPYFNVVEAELEKWLSRVKTQLN
jgi:hypothetical protein